METLQLREDFYWTQKSYLLFRELIGIYTLFFLQKSPAKLL